MSFEFISEVPQEAATAANFVILIGSAQNLKLRDKAVQPDYPQMAKLSHIQGTVVIAAAVGADGAIRELHLVSGHPMLARAAWDAIRQWHYKPYIYHGSPVAYDILIEVSFTMPYS